LEENTFRRHDPRVCNPRGLNKEIVTEVEGLQSVRTDSRICEEDE